MTIDDQVADLGDLTPQDIYALAQEVVKRLDGDQLTTFTRWCAVDEPERREQEKAKAQAVADFVDQAREAGILPPVPTIEEAQANLDGVAEWAAGEHVPTGDFRRKDGRLYRSVFPGLNPYEPGLPETWAAWEDVTPVVEDAGTGAIEWRTGLDLKAGQLVTHNGVTYVVTRDITTVDPTHTPDVLIGHYYQEVHHV